MRTVLVFVHAIPGVIGLIAGLWSLAPPQNSDGRRRWRQVYAACIALLIAGLIVLVAYDWNELDGAARIAFAGLGGLAAVMVYRLWLAHRAASRQRDGWQQRYVDHVYFTYIALWIGFLIVPALNLPAPQVVAPAVAGAVLLAGHVLIKNYKQQVIAPSGGSSLGP